MDTVQLGLRARCPRCGAQLHDDREIGAMAEDVIGALRNRRLSVPDAVYASLREIAGEMWCRVGVCGEVARR